ncbi:MAG: hypothetical protein R8G66_14365 [Cytophagales bacterium]|nr:hypothetical protein [Cytophagales bacterium]
MKRILFLGAFFLLAFSSFSQQWNITDKLYVGGGVGLNLNSNVTSYSVSPYAGYKLTDRLSAGLRFTYQHTRFSQTDFRINSVGVGPFTRFQINEKFFAYTEYEYLNFKVTNPSLSNEAAREGFNSFFVGGGMSQPIGRNASFNVIFLYNLLYNDGTNSPYNSPIVIRGGIDLGFFN